MTGEITIERYIEGWRATGRLARSPGVWLSLAILVAIKGVLLAAIYHFRDPGLSRFMAPVIENLFGERAVHFPDHVLLLGSMYSKIDVVVTIAPGFLLIAWFMLRVTHALREKRMTRRECVAQSARLMPKMFVAWTLFALAWKGVPMLAGSAGALVQHARIQTLVILFGHVASLTIRGIVLYAPVYVTLSRRGVFASARSSLRMARDFSWLTGMIVLTGWGLQAPLGYLVSMSPRVLELSGGEPLFWILMAYVVLEGVALLYVFASASTLVAVSTEQERT